VEVLRALGKLGIGVVCKEIVKVARDGVTALGWRHSQEVFRYSFGKKVKSSRETRENSTVSICLGTEGLEAPTISKKVTRSPPCSSRPALGSLRRTRR